ncbi:helix-turn-helix transcriptional regulator [Psychrobacillus sp.]|uniref:helix-turn-helix domain-containing protein n=1 Tax=Psychrobacillus sp. TaxID=1871623 RepID=UPI0028BDB41F|nr:helix-turn-helix transcriptional regulator [Psychrobacillus sp.]
MPFHEHICEYRQQIEITQTEAALRLGIDHSVLSKYELGTCEIPIYLLPIFKRVYSIPDILFLQMLDDNISIRKNSSLQAQENIARYSTELQNELQPLYIGSKEFRTFALRVSLLNNKEIKQLLEDLI